ncbi:amidohydrolase family protein [Hyphomonas sp.]|jgi:imidazolonepropionase-like amidohydrolase|uniref:Xaa-Pro dipeptidase n=1 Tax=Hyphomonas sp. TaxID=87 RepID=UPI0025BE5C17|nr:amidohydrolase family protein [Hyphomonas sp.]
MLRALFTAASLFALSAAATAETTLLTGGHVIDVERGTVMKDYDILVENGAIKAVGRKGTLGASGAAKIDMKGAFLLPGLSDSHVHLTSRSDLHGYRRLAVSTPRSAISGVANAEKTLRAGFTTVRNLGGPGFADVDLKDAIDTGEIPGPRIIPAGQSIGITGGHCDNNLLPYEDNAIGGGVADGPWAVRQKVRENKKYGAEVIKFCGTGGVLSKGTTIGAQQFTLEEMQAIVSEAHELGMKVAVHAHGAKGIQTALEAGVDSVEHASLISDESLALAVKQGTFLSMDIYVSDFILGEGEAAGILPESLEKEKIVGQAQRERFQAATKAGAKIAFGTDAGVYTHGLNARQFALMVKWGMSPAEAIRAATLGNAELFGLKDQIGSLAAGKRADIIAVDGDPLADVRQLEDVDFVMKDGAVFYNGLGK